MIRRRRRSARDGRVLFVLFDDAPAHEAWYDPDAGTVIERWIAAGGNPQELAHRVPWDHAAVPPHDDPPYEAERLEWSCPLCEAAIAVVTQEALAYFIAQHPCTAAGQAKRRGPFRPVP